MTETREQMVREVLESVTAQSFAPGFADRAAARWRADRASTFAPIVERQFRRLVPLAIAASLLFAFVSVRARDSSSGQSVAQAVLGWRPSAIDTLQLATLEWIYGLDASSLAQ